MENQTTTHKKPSNRSVTGPRARPLIPIQNQTSTSETVGRPSVGRPSDTAGRPSVGRPSVEAPLVGARSVGGRSVGTPSQPVPELSKDAKRAIEDKAGTIRGATDRDFVYPKDLRLFLNDLNGKPLGHKWLNCSGINVYCEMILDRSQKSDELPKFYVFQPDSDQLGRD